MLLCPFIVTVSGLTDPEASPLQNRNPYPALGTAVSWTAWPRLYHTLGGVVVGLPAGLRFTTPFVPATASRGWNESGLMGSVPSRYSSRLRTPSPSGSSLPL